MSEPHEKTFGKQAAKGGAATAVAQGNHTANSGTTKQERRQGRDPLGKMLDGTLSWIVGLSRGK